MFFFLGYATFIAAMEPDAPYGGLVFVRIDNKTNHDCHVAQLRKFFEIKTADGYRYCAADNLKVGIEQTVIGKHSEKIFNQACLMQNHPEGKGAYRNTCNLQLAQLFGMQSCHHLDFNISRSNTHKTIDFALTGMPKSRSGITDKQFDYDPAQQADAYAVKITLDSDEFEQSSIDVTQIKNRDLVTVLKSYHANSNGTDPQGLTPLLWLFNIRLWRTPQQSYEIVEFLIKAGADLNVQDYGGQTILHKLAHREWQDHRDVVKRLLQAGANPEIEEKYYKYTPFMIAYRNNNATFGQVLLDHAKSKIK